MLKKAIILTYFHVMNFVKNIFSLCECNTSASNEMLNRGIISSDSEIPKIIWMYWNDVIPPKTVVISYKMCVKKNPDHEVYLVNESNLKEYVNIEFNEAVHILPAHKSDLIRLSLLKEYGGIWVDASTMMFDSLGWVHTKQKESQLDYVGYYHKRSTVDFDFPVIENWLIAVPKNSLLIYNWLNALSPLLYKGSSLVADEIRNSNDFDDIKQNIDNIDYMISYLLLQRIIRQYKVSYFLKCSEDDAFYLQEKNGWKSYKTAVDICIRKNRCNNLSIIKLTSLDRYYIDEICKLNLVNGCSVFGKLEREYEV